jgi:hypothetical protein
MTGPAGKVTGIQGNIVYPLVRTAGPSGKVLGPEAPVAFPEV